MATYRCLVSGNTVTFTYTHDIESMKGHAGYIRIDEPEPKEEEDRPLPMTAPVKKPGRPPKPKGD